MWEFILSFLLWFLGLSGADSKCDPVHKKAELYDTCAKEYHAE